MTTESVGAPSSTSGQVGPATGGADSSRSRLREYGPLVPFHAYVLLFLILPTIIVAAGAFSAKDGGVTLDNISKLVTRADFVSAFMKTASAVAAARATPRLEPPAWKITGVRCGEGSQRAMPGTAKCLPECWIGWTRCGSRAWPDTPRPR